MSLTIMHYYLQTKSRPYPGCTENRRGECEARRLVRINHVFLSLLRLTDRPNFSKKMGSIKTVMSSMFQNITRDTATYEGKRSLSFL